jgi:starch-binding outer membrane protein, SusD/RagB family
MFWPTRRCSAARLAFPLLILGCSVLIGCDPLRVSDPTAIQESDLNNANGAGLLRTDALGKFNKAAGAGALAGALLSDEYLSDPPSYYAQYGFVDAGQVLDQRDSQKYEALLAQSNGGVYGAWQEVRRATTVAIPKLRAYLPDSVALTYVGEMFAMRGFASLRLAEDFCPGFPLHDLIGFQLSYGDPLTTNQVFQRGLADFDSALAHVAPSSDVANLAHVGKARAFLGLARLTEAAAEANLVPSDYTRNSEFVITSDARLANPLVVPDFFGQFTIGVANNEGRNGLDYIGSQDPRLPTKIIGTAQDGVSSMYSATKYVGGDTPIPIVLASGLEARLIEAESALSTGGNWLGILNELRASEGLSPLADPGTTGERVDLLFRERAFWLFGTGHRLADLRRLVSQYARNPETVFPTGTYRLGGVYGTATSIPFPAVLESPYNPAVTGCTAR